MKAVYVVHRHGARFPSSGQQHNLSFPIDQRFWDDHGMELTPRGVQQLYSLGIQLQSYNLPVSKVYCSNTSRTILSAMSLLDGLAPELPHVIEYGYRRPSSNTQSIRIQVEERKNDSLFHLGVDQKHVHQQWINNNINNSNKFNQAISNIQVNDLLDKIYTMTHCEKMCSSNPNRLCEITSYVNMLRYSDVHNSSFLPNILNLTLNDSERQMVVKLSDLVYSHRYQPHDNNYHEQKGSIRCAMLLDQICAHIRDGSSGMHIYSAHDTTLLSMSAFFGISIPCPDFASYYMFEVYDNYVNVKFNPRPTTTTLSSLLPIYWSKSDEYINLGDCDHQPFPLDEFVDRFSHSNYHLLPQIIERKITGEDINYSFDYYVKDNVWNDDSIKELYYRFQQPEPPHMNVNITREEFAMTYQ